MSMKVREVMKKRVVTAGPELTVMDAANIMTKNRIGSVIIMENQKPVSIFTTDDITTVVSKGLNPKKTRIRDLPKKKLVTASPDESIIKVMERMVKNGVKRLPVLRNGRMEGIVSDKEVLIISPELINILSEKLKARVESVAIKEDVLSGICENCEGYSDELKSIGGKWLCEDCRENQ